MLTRLERYLLIGASFVGVAIGAKWAFGRLLHQPDVEGQWTGVVGKNQVQLVVGETVSGLLSGVAVITDSTGVVTSELLRLEGLHGGAEVSITLLADRNITQLLIARFTDDNQLTGHFYRRVGPAQHLVLSRL